MQFGTLLKHVRNTSSRGCGGTGRRAGFRIQFLRECRFNSCQPHSIPNFLTSCDGRQCETLQPKTGFSGAFAPFKMCRGTARRVQTRGSGVSSLTRRGSANTFRRKLTCFWAVDVTFMSHPLLFVAQIPLVLSPSFSAIATPSPNLRLVNTFDVKIERSLAQSSLASRSLEAHRT